MDVDRFWSKADRRGPDECWPWLDGLSNGYGRFHIAGKSAKPAHRIAYELLVGPIPDGLQIDHLCRNRACVNPAHLEPVTVRENVLRGIGPSAIAAKATHCPQGHEYTPENTRQASSGRRCRTCEKAYKHARLAADPEPMRASRAKWRAANVERRRQYDVDRRRAASTLRSTKPG